MKMNSTILDLLPKHWITCAELHHLKEYKMKKEQRIRERNMCSLHCPNSCIGNASSLAAPSKGIKKCR